MVRLSLFLLILGKFAQKGENMDCEKCGNPIKADEHCYQVRYGCIEDDGITFLPEEDVAYRCEDCGVDRDNS